jgi:hypothetical protein
VSNFDPIQAAVAVLVVIITASSSLLLPRARSPLAKRKAPLREIRSRLQRLAGIAAEMNAYLVIVAIGVVALDLSALAAINLPSSSGLDAGVVTTASAPNPTNLVWDAP